MARLPDVEIQRLKHEASLERACEFRIPTTQTLAPCRHHRERKAAAGMLAKGEV